MTREEKKGRDVMKWAERKEKKKREHEQPLAMNLDKEKRPTRRELKSLFCLSLFDGKRKLDEYQNNIQCFQGNNIDLLVHKSLFPNPRVYLG